VATEFATADFATAEADLSAPLAPRGDLVHGRLDNGFEYVLVPNKTPSGRFEAHLQMHVGSVDEKEDEQVRG